MEKRKETMTVLEKWTRDIEGMEGTVKAMTNAAKKYGVTVKEDVREMRESAVARQKAAEAYWADFKKRVDALTQKAKAFEKSCHQETKQMKESVVRMQRSFENYATRFMETVKGMTLHIWGEYKVVP